MSIIMNHSITHFPGHSLKSTDLHQLKGPRSVSPTYIPNLLLPFLGFANQPHQAHSASQTPLLSPPHPPAQTIYHSLESLQCEKH